LGEDRQPGSRNHEERTCPGVPPLAREVQPLRLVLRSSQHLNSSEFRSLHTAKATQPPGSQNPRISPCRGRKEYSAVQRKTESGCKPWPGQPGRSDPKQSIWNSGRGSLPYQLMEQADSRRRKDLWDYAPNYRQTDQGRR